MAKIYGELEKAQLENVTSDVASEPAGMVKYRTDESKMAVSDGTIYKKVITEDLLSAVGPDYPEIVTPANPAASLHKIYFKADGKMYKLNAAGSEEEIGAGGSGSKNYFPTDSSNIESNVGQWTTDDGIGGVSANVTLSVTAVAGELLEGNNSLKITKSAANNSGHFAKIALLAIDPSDRGRTNYGSFEFRSLAGYVAADLVLEVFDVTNAAVLYSGNVTDNEIGVGKARIGFIAHLETTTAAIEFRLKVNNVNTNAYDVVCDEFVFGPSATSIINQYQLVSTEVLTSVISSDIVISDLTFAGLVVGDTYKIGGQVQLRTTTDSFHGILIKDGTTTIGRIGRDPSGVTSISQAQFGVSVVFVATDTTLTFEGSGLTAGRDVFGNNTKTGTYITLERNSNNLLTENALSLLTLKAGAFMLSNSLALVTGVTTVVPLDGIIFDDSGLVDIVNDRILILKTAKYKLDASVLYQNTGAGRRITGIRVNADNNIGARGILPAGSSGQGTVSASAVLSLVKGDFLELTAFQESGGNINILSNGSIGLQDTFLTIAEEPELNLYGVVADEAPVYIATEVPADVDTVTADAWLPIAGATISLLKDVTYDVGYDISCRHVHTSGANVFNVGNAALFDNTASARLDSTISLSSVVTSSTNDEIHASLSRSTRIKPTIDTILQLQLRSNLTGAGKFRVRGPDVTGTITNPDNASVIWARKV